MKNLKIIATTCVIMFTSSLSAQNLSVKDKTLKVEDFPEYIIINTDNITSILGKTIRMVIQAQNSEFEKPLKNLEYFLEDREYLKISNQTDLLNAMSKLGFDYVNAFPQNSSETVGMSRTGFVFRKKEKYRD